MNYIEILDTFFDDKRYAQVTDKDKESSSFLINRQMSANNPKLASRMNRNGIVGKHVVDYWRMVMSRKYNHKPKFFYASTKKNKIEEPFKYDKECLLSFVQEHAMSIRDFMECLKMDDDGSTLEQYKSYESAWKASR